MLGSSYALIAIGYALVFGAVALAQAAEREHWATDLRARVTAVVSNRPQAGGLDKARALGLTTHVVDHRAYASREAFEAALSDVIATYEQPDAPTLVLLAGFMRILGEDFVRRYEGRLLNIHPSLLPAFPGLHTHQRALDAGCKVAGATVHLVTPELDHGPILEQAVVPVLPGDDAVTLAQRVLTQEHGIYPRAVARWLRLHC